MICSQGHAPYVVILFESVWIIHPNPVFQEQSVFVACQTQTPEVYPIQRQWQVFKP